jgi:hypothetical protein
MDLADPRISLVSPLLGAVLGGVVHDGALFRLVGWLLTAVGCCCVPGSCACDYCVPRTDCYCSAQLFNHHPPPSPSLTDSVNHHYQSSPSPLLFSSHQLSTSSSASEIFSLFSLAEASRPDPVAVLGHCSCLSHIHTKLPRKGAFPDNHLSTSFTPSRRILSFLYPSSRPIIHFNHPGPPESNSASHTIILAIL